MASTLADYSMQALNDGYELVNNIADWTLKTSMVLQKLPWDTNSQLAVKITAWESFPTIGTRKINASFSESSGKFQQKVEDKYIFGHYIDADTVLVKAGKTIGDVRQNQRRASAKAMGFKFNNMWINGDPASEEFKGLKMRVDDVNAAGYTDQYFDAGSATNNRGVLYDSTEQHKLFDTLSKIVAVTAEPPDAMFLNLKLLLCIESAARRLSLLDHTKDMFGRVVTTFSGVPLIDMGNVSAFSTTLVLPNNEILSSGTEETSIYAAKFGSDEYLWGIQQDNMEVIDHGRLATSSVYRDEVQWVVGLAISNPRSIVRAYGLVADADAS